MIINPIAHITVLPTPTKKDVNFYDYDGELVAGYSIAEAQALTASPTTPTHAELTFQEWNYTLTEVNATTSPLDIGATYITTDGKSHFHITLTAVSGLAPAFYFNKSDTSELTIDYGDGTTATSSASGDINFAHTYATAGDYVVKTWISSGGGTYGFGNGASSTTVVGGATVAYSQTLTKVFVGAGVTSIGGYAFRSCTSLVSITLPSSVTSIGGYAFAACSSLTYATIPSSVTSISIAAFQNCYSLTYATIPSSVTSIGGGVFQNCYSCKTYIIKAITPPTLVASLAFGGIVSICKILVPAASLTAYQTATNWSTYANYMEGY